MEPLVMTKSNKKYVDEYINEIYEQYELHKYEWVAYTLRSTYNPNIMYCGSTNNIKRRLRQHNRVITGGAQYTTKLEWPKVNNNNFNNNNSNSNSISNEFSVPWKLAALIVNIPNKSTALRTEWYTKAKNYKKEDISDIPTNDSVKRRIYLIKKSMSITNMSDIILMDPDFVGNY